MTTLTYRQYGWQRLMQYLPASAIGAKIFSGWLPFFDRSLMHFSNDRLSVPSVLNGLPVIILTTVGVKSGMSRATPVIGIPDGENIALVASNWGKPRHPQWYYNLLANPKATLEFNGQTIDYIAEEVTEPQEYQRLWRKANAVYLGYDKYQQRAGKRKIPVLILRPKPDREG